MDSHIRAGRVALIDSHRKQMEVELFFAPYSIRGRGSSAADRWTIDLDDKVIDVGDEDVKGRGDRQMVVETKVPRHSKADVATDIEVIPQQIQRRLLRVVWRLLHLVRVIWRLFFLLRVIWRLLPRLIQRLLLGFDETICTHRWKVSWRVL